MAIKKKKGQLPAVEVEEEPKKWKAKEKEQPIAPIASRGNSTRGGPHQYGGGRGARGFAGRAGTGGRGG